MKLKDFLWMFDRADNVEIYTNNVLTEKNVVRNIVVDYKYIDTYFESFEYVGYKNKVGLLKIYLRKEEEYELR